MARRTVSWWVCPLLIAAVGSFLANFGPCPEADAGTGCIETSDPRLLSALASGDWLVVSQLQNASPPCSLDVVALLLRAHGALAEGNHNAASMLFYLAGATGDTIAWPAWTESFVRAHEGSAVAHYLRGDSMARAHDRVSAISAYARALEIQPDLVLARNARGVCHGMEYQRRVDAEAGDDARGELVAMTEDLVAAAKSDPSFADAPLNLGLMFLETGRLEGARDYIDEAIRRDPSSGLAHNAKAMLQLQETDAKGAGQSLLVADSLLPRFPPIMWNARAVTDSTDTTSALGRLAWVEGASLGLNEDLGFSVDWNRFAGGFDRTLGGALDLAGVGAWYDITVGVGQMFNSVSFDFNYGGVYLSVHVQSKTMRVGTHYALAFPRK